jgi:hypothetical protein
VAAGEEELRTRCVALKCSSSCWWNVEPSDPALPMLNMNAPVWASPLSLKPPQWVEVSCERRQAGVLQGYGDERAGLGEGDVDATVVDQPDVLHAEPLGRAGHATSRDI